MTRCPASLALLVASCVFACVSRALEPPVRVVDEAVVGDLTLEGLPLGMLEEGNTRIIGSIGTNGDDADTVSFTIPDGLGWVALRILDYEGLGTLAPTLTTPAPSLVVDAPSAPPAAATVPPTFETLAPTDFDAQVLGGVHIAEGSVGIFPTPETLPDLLGGMIVSPSTTGDILPALSNATLDFDGSTPIPPPLGTGFEIPLLGGPYTLTVSDGAPLTDRASYAIDIEIRPVADP